MKKPSVKSRPLRGHGRTHRGVPPPRPATVAAARRCAACWPWRCEAKCAARLHSCGGLLHGRPRPRWAMPAGTKVGWKLDHVAVLVRSIEESVEQLAGLLGAAMPVPGEIEEFPGEGTRECYLEGANGNTCRLLLMQALTLDGGPYARAMAKRGPGLHHIGVHVAALSDVLAAGTADLCGWCSLRCLERHATFCQGCKRTEWLFCRDVPVLLEVSQAGKEEDLPPLVTAVELPAPAECEPALRLCGFDLAAPGENAAVRLTVGGRQLRVSDFCG